MFSQIYYLIRSRTDGSYLVAHLNRSEDQIERQAQASSYLLLFAEQYDALSYLNTHAKDLSDRFGVESIPGSQIKEILQRWGFEGIGVVQDPLIPAIEFLRLQ